MRSDARALRIAGTVLSLTFVGAAALSETPEPAVLLARARQAAGGEAWSGVRTIHSTLAFETGGMKGRVESLVDLVHGRYADRYELGPASGAEGFDGKTGWEQDASGQVRTRDSADEREGAVNEAYRRSRAYWFPERGKAAIERGGERREGDRRFDVLRISPQGGRPFELWIDASTFLFDRIVEKGATETRTDFLSDYREVAGLRLPYGFRSTNGNARYDQFGHVEKVEVNAELADALFAAPPPPAADFRIAGGKGSTSVPFDLVNGHIYLDGRLNGRVFRLLCDTGGANVITPAVARELGVKPEGALEGKGAGEKSEDVGLVKLESVQIGDAIVERQLFAVFDLARLEPAEGAPLPGLVGYEIFKRFAVRIDYGRRLLTLTLPSAFEAPKDAASLPFRFNGHTPQVDGSVDGVPGAFDIDTGSRASLDLLGPFVEKNSLVAHYKATLEGITGWGVGGPARSLLARSRSLKLGSVEAPDVVTMLSLQKKGSFSNTYVAGNVGWGVLRRFTVTFDYGSQRLYLEPTTVDPGRDSYDRSGLWLNQGAGFFEVVDVIKESPGSEAGLRAGDRIVAVDGVAASAVRLPDLRLRLRSEPPGTRVRLRVKSGQSEHDTTVVLRDLV
jgi:hypothetical protein